MASFAKSAIITFLTRVATAISTIIITVIMARTLGPNGQGIYSVAVLFPSLILIFTGFSLNSAVVYFLAKGEYSPRQILGTSIISNILISIFSILVGLIIIIFFGNIFFPGIEKIYLFLSLLFIPLTLFFNLGCNVGLGLQKFKEYNLISFVQVALFSIFIAVFLLVMRFGVTVTILSQIFSYIISIIFLLFIFRIESQGVDFKINKAYLKDSLIFGLKTHLGVVFDFLHSRIDLFLINFFINPFSAGIYFASVRLAEGVWLFSSSTGTVLVSKLAAEKDSQKIKDFTPLICRNVLFFSAFMIVAFFAISGGIITFLYSTSFSGAIMPFKILLVGIFAISGWHILSMDLIARGKPLLNTYAIGISVILNIILNIIFIPRWGISGAALATTISYTLMFFVTLGLYAKISGNKIIDILFIKKEDFIFYKEALLSFRKNRLNDPR